LAKECNVPTPETAFPGTMSDVERYLTTALFPILVKPTHSGPGAFPIRLVQTRSELVEFCESVWQTSTSSVMLQEYIPGGDEMTWAFNGYFDGRGKCLVALTGRKLRNYPPYFGPGSLGVCVHNEQVKQATIAFMQSIGYRGALDLGYRYDVRDGRYKVHDINPRIGAMFRCFVGDDGADIARAVYWDMTGQPVLPITVRDGRKWIVEDSDWISALRYYRDGKLTLRGWLDSVRGVEEWSYIAGDDLRPVGTALRSLLETTGSRTKRWFSRSGTAAPRPIATGQNSLTVER
jgi:predicted ATP-grasp superfamily ATP-dependent carboligase